MGASCLQLHLQRLAGWPVEMELREYYDPLDGTLLDVELVPPGYPIVHNFEPDLEAFYNDWI